MSEYQMLREELLDIQKSIVQYNSLTYTVSAAILTFALKEDSSFLFCLIPYIVIVPLYLASEAARNSICRIASYLYVFHEGDDFNWETRKLSFDSDKKRNWKSIFMYYFVSIICSILSIYKLVIGEYNCMQRALYILLVLVITIISIIIMKKNTINYSDNIKAKAADWQKIKEEEAQRKDISI